ncbi:MAG: SH3 domain-containing protein [Oceanidesulfovibrio sp.]
MSIQPNLRPLLLITMTLALFAMGCSKNAGGGPYVSRTSSVTAHRLNVRADPSSKAHIIEVLARGQEVDVLDRQYDWIKVRTPNRHVGWVYGAFLQGFDIPEPSKESPEYKEGSPEGESPENMGEGKPLVL